MVRRTKIVATIGPASDPPEVLEGMIRAGLDVVRLNLSHGTIAEHLRRLATIREVAARCGRVVGVLADLPGPKVRSGPFPDGGILLAEGSVVRLEPGGGPCSPERITVEYPTLLDDLRPGDAVILGDGAISLRVRAVTGDHAEVVVETEGRVHGRPGVHIPAERLRLRAPTTEDLDLLGRIVPAGVDFVAVSFVRTPADLVQVRDAVGPDGPMLVAKIETAQAVASLDALLEVTDAVMVARGDLGIECPLEDVPLLQKRVIRSCVTAGVPVITATQMLESMIQSPAPTRAEVSDVANAVLDGSDAVMLSAETAIGHDPVAAVTMMARVAARAEAGLDAESWAPRPERPRGPMAMPGASVVTTAMARAAWQAVDDSGARAILCCTRTGLTARAMARLRPRARLVGLSPDDRTTRRLALSWGVEPVRVEEYRSTDELVRFALERARQAGLIDRGDLVAVLAGAPDRSGSATDVLRLVRVP